MRIFYNKERLSPGSGPLIFLCFLMIVILMAVAYLLADSNSADAAVRDDSLRTGDYSYRFLQAHNNIRKTVSSSTPDSSDLINYLYKGGDGPHCP